MALRKIAGWKNDSQMVAVYLHYNEDDVKQQVYKKVYGIELDDNGSKLSERMLKGRTCMKCNTENPMQNDYCNSCHYPLNMESLTQIESIKKIVNEELSKLLPEILDKIGGKDTP